MAVMGFRRAVYLPILLICGACAKPEPTPYELAESAMLDGKFDTVEKRCSEILTKYPQNWEARLLRGRAFAAKDRHQDAIDDFTIVIGLRPMDPEPLYRRALSYRGLGRTELADEDDRLAKSFDVDYLKSYAYSPTPSTARAPATDHRRDAEAENADDRNRVENGSDPTDADDVDDSVADAETPRGRKKKESRFARRTRQLEERAQSLRESLAEKSETSEPDSDVTDTDPARTLERRQAEAKRTVQPKSRTGPKVRAKADVIVLNDDLPTDDRDPVVEPLEPEAPEEEDRIRFEMPPISTAIPATPFGGIPDWRAPPDIDLRPTTGLRLPTNPASESPYVPRPGITTGLSGPVGGFQPGFSGGVENRPTTGLSGGGFGVPSGVPYSLYGMPNRPAPGTARSFVGPLSSPNGTGPLPRISTSLPGTEIVPIPVGPRRLSTQLPPRQLRQEPPPVISTALPESP